MANITIKDIPDEIYDQLKEIADEHRRSINQEVITCLERYVAGKRTSGEDWLEQIREIREVPENGPLTESEVDEAINKGRE